MSCICEAHSAVQLFGAPGIDGVSGAPAPPNKDPPEKTCTCPVVPVPATYSAVGSPMRVIRHSSVSALPVETAMSGMLVMVSPDATAFGSPSDLSAWGL